MPLPARIQKISRSLAREQIRLRIQSWIVEGELRPEELISDKQIATAFGVSRMPVREALRTLEDQGFIETALNRWTRVAPLRLEQAQKLYSIVARLEELAMETALPLLTEEDLRQLQNAMEDFRKAAEGTSALKALRADMRFHAVWIQRACNPDLERILTQCRTKLMRIELEYFQSPADLRASYREHQRILTALEAPERSAVLLELKNHWKSSVDRCMARVNEDQALTAARKGQHATE